MCITTPLSMTRSAFYIQPWPRALSDMPVVTTEKSLAGWIGPIEKSFGQYVLSGWAVLPSKSRVADGVLVAVLSDARLSTR
jgi:hypothetical protein